MCYFCTPYVLFPVHLLLPVCGLLPVHIWCKFTSCYSPRFVASLWLVACPRFVASPCFVASLLLVASPRFVASSCFDASTRLVASSRFVASTVYTFRFLSTSCCQSTFCCQPTFVASPCLLIVHLCCQSSSCMASTLSFLSTSGGFAIL